MVSVDDHKSFDNVLEAPCPVSRNACLKNSKILSFLIFQDASNALVAFVSTLCGPRRYVKFLLSWLVDVMV